MTDDPVLCVPEAGHVLEASLRQWVRALDAFRRWERAEIYLKEPSAETLAGYRRDLKWLLRCVRMVHSVVTDPDFEDASLANEIGGMLIHLEEAWKSLNNPMTEAEADAILAKCFPDEARA